MAGCRFHEQGWDCRTQPPWARGGAADKEITTDMSWTEHVEFGDGVLQVQPVFVSVGNALHLCMMTNNILAMHCVCVCARVCDQVSGTVLTTLLKSKLQEMAVSSR
jgi:hypothetical protein